MSKTLHTYTAIVDISILEQSRLEAVIRKAKLSPHEVEVTISYKKPFRADLALAVIDTIKISGDPNNALITALFKPYEGKLKSFFTVTLNNQQS